MTSTDPKSPLRPDGRPIPTDDGTRINSTLRPLSCELSCLHRADGSALWKSGSTHVLASVYGPIAPRIPSQENGERALVSVVLKSTNNYSSEWEPLLTTILTACIDVQVYARTVVQVVLQVIQDDGGVLAAALHAAVAALMDAGVAMHQLPVATTFLVQDNNNNNTNLILLDPTAQEEKESSVLVLVTENNNNTEEGNLLATHSSRGKFTIPTILTCAKAAVKAAPAVVAFWRLAVEQRVTRESQTLWSST